MQMRFAKYEGAGNDFILLDLRNGGATPQSAEICATAISASEPTV